MLAGRGCSNMNGFHYTYTDFRYQKQQNGLSIQVKRGCIPPKCIFFANSSEGIKLLTFFFVVPVNEIQE